MGLSYWFLAAWVAGGVALATLLLVAGERKPFALALAALGFGGAGFGARLLGYHRWQITLSSALATCILCALIGYGLQRLHARAAR